MWPATEKSMAAQIIPLSRRENVETPARLCSPLHAPLSSSLTCRARRLWHRLRQFAETLGWFVIVASIIAAVR